MIKYTYDIKKHENVFFTSDLHFGHKNIIKYNPATRGYDSSDAMDASLINHWNSKVSDDDLVIIVGDISLHSLSYTEELMGYLKGDKIIVFGNHDQRLQKQLCNRNAKINKHFIMSGDILSFVYNDNQFIACHYPIYEWPYMSNGAIHVHGHMHGVPTNIKGKIIDIGWDAVGGKIIHADEVIELTQSLEIRPHGNERRPSSVIN